MEILKERPTALSPALTLLFLFSAAGSALAALLYVTGGWWETVLTGAAVITLVFAVFLTEFRSR